MTTGILQEIIAGKTGPGKNGKPPWTMYFAKIDGTKYGTGFEKVKAAIGSTVEFEIEENGDFKNVAKGSFKVLKEATSAESAAVSKSNAGTEQAKQSSIESQKALEYATAITLAFVGTEGFDEDAALSLVQKAYKVCSGLLNPAAKAVPAAAKKPAKPPVDEEEEDLPPY